MPILNDRECAILREGNVGAGRVAAVGDLLDTVAALRSENAKQAAALSNGMAIVEGSLRANWTKIINDGVAEAIDESVTRAVSVVASFAMAYPEDIFPEGTSSEAVAAKMARHVCKASDAASRISSEMRDRIATLEAERDAAVEREAGLRTALATVQERADEADGRLDIEKRRHEETRGYRQRAEGERDALRPALHALACAARPFAVAPEDDVRLDDVTREEHEMLKAAYSRACTALGEGR